jgi:hypothetical protein
VDAVDNGLRRSRRKPDHSSLRIIQDIGWVTLSVLVSDLLWAASQHCLSPEEPVNM